MNVTMYATFIWNWSKFALCDDVIFITSRINMHLKLRSNGPHKGENYFGCAFARNTKVYLVY